MEKQNKICVYKGDPVNPGVSIQGTGVNFAVEIPCGVPASLVLYRKGAALPEREIPFTEEYRAQNRQIRIQFPHRRKNLSGSFCSGDSGA